MSRRLVARVLVGSALLLVIPFATPVGAVQSAALSSSARACKAGGWRSLSDAQGQPFRNQGQCAAFVVKHPVNLADLAGSFTDGTGTAVFHAGTCPMVVASPFDVAYYVTNDIAYSGSAAVGAVALHYEGCADFSNDNFLAGTFRISTNVGSLSGTAEGGVTATLDQDFNVTVDVRLAFDVTSGTGAFSTTTGTLSLTEHGPPMPPVTGTVSA